MYYPPSWPSRRTHFLREFRSVDFRFYGHPTKFRRRFRMFEEKVRKLLHRLSMTSENDVRTVRTIPGHVIRAISTFGVSPSTIESAPGQLATLDSQRPPLRNCRWTAPHGHSGERTYTGGIPSGMPPSKPHLPIVKSQGLGSRKAAAHLSAGSFSGLP